MNEKLEKAKEKISVKIKKAKEVAGKLKEAVKTWAKENPEEAAGLVCSSVFISGGAIVKAIDKARKDKEEYKDRECRQWDPVTGQYYYTKRPMTMNEKLELDRRMQNGERKGIVLKDMGVL